MKLGPKNEINKQRKQKLSTDLCWIFWVKKSSIWFQHTPTVDYAPFCTLSPDVLEAFRKKELKANFFNSHENRL